MFCSTACTQSAPQNDLVRTPSRHPITVTALQAEQDLTMSKSEKRQRTALLGSVRCYPEEKEQIQDSAKAAGLSTGEFLRRSALGRRIVAKGDTKQMNEILKLGGLQKHLYTEMQKLGMMTPELSKQFADTLAALQKTLMKFRADSLNNTED